MGAGFPAGRGLDGGAGRCLTLLKLGDKIRVFGMSASFAGVWGGDER